MYLSFIHQIISVILFTNLYQLVHSDNNDIPSKLISKNFNDHYLPTITNDKDNETQNGSLSIIIRMIAFGIQPIDDEQQKLGDTDLPVSLLPSKAPNRSEDEQTKELQQNTQSLFLPLMIRMLLERMAERDNTIQQSKDLQKFYEINYGSNTNKFLKTKQTNFYKSVKRLIIITADREKFRMIVFLILSFSIFVFTLSSIIRCLRVTHNDGSLSVNSKNNHEETKNLLP